MTMSYPIAPSSGFHSVLCQSSPINPTRAALPPLSTAGVSSSATPQGYARSFFTPMSIAVSLCRYRWHSPCSSNPLFVTQGSAETHRCKQRPLSCGDKAGAVPEHQALATTCVGDS